MAQPQKLKMKAALHFLIKWGRASPTLVPNDHVATADLAETVFLRGLGILGLLHFQHLRPARVLRLIDLFSQVKA